MTGPEIEERFTTVEAALAEYIITTNRSQLRLERALEQLSKEMKEFKDEMKEFKDEMKEFKDEMKEFKDEMKEFKDEMKEFKDEMKEFKDEMKDFKDEMKDFKDEMKDFKDEMKSYKDESRQEFRKMKKQWGELANKMGTLVEDIIAPAVRPVMEQYFKEEVTYLAVNVRKKDKAQNLRGEFDVIAASASRVFLIETKSSPKKEQISTFKNEVIPRFRQLFPEYDHLQLTPVFSSLRFDEELIDVGTQEGIYMMAYREWDYMDLLNFEALSKP